MGPISYWTPGGSAERCLAVGRGLVYSWREAPILGDIHERRTWLHRPELHLTHVFRPEMTDSLGPDPLLCTYYGVFTVE